MNWESSRQEKGLICFLIRVPFRNCNFSSDIAQTYAAWITRRYTETASLPVSVRLMAELYLPPPRTSQAPAAVLAKCTHERSGRLWTWPSTPGNLLFL